MYEYFINEWEDYGPMAVEEVRRYIDRTKKSKEIHHKITDYIPYGVNSNQRYYRPYPLYFNRAYGTRIWDVDGNEYIDFNMAYGALMVGHAHPLLSEELKNQLDNGILYTYPHDLLEELVDIIPDQFDIDMFRFSNSGSEAVMFAIRLARAFTGRDKIVKLEGSYHGTYDYMLVSTFPSWGLMGPRRFPLSVVESLGVPDLVEDYTIIVPFNNVEALKMVLEEEADEIAAFIIEPVMMNCGIIPPKNNYLRNVKKLAREYDILLIFDEIKTAMRAHPGTAAQLLGIEPDLITMAKSIGGGAPISLIGGDEDIMSLIGPGERPARPSVMHAGTYNANPLALRALYITLTEILTEDAYPKMLKLNGMLKKGYKGIFDEFAISAYIETFGVSGSIIFSKRKVYDFRSYLKTNMDLWYPYFISMLNRGIIPMAVGPEEMWTVSVQHTEDDVIQHLEAAREAAKAIIETHKFIKENW